MLDLPSSSRVHLVVHVSLPKKYHGLNQTANFWPISFQDQHRFYEDLHNMEETRGQGSVGDIFCDFGEKSLKEITRTKEEVLNQNGEGKMRAHQKLQEHGLNESASDLISP